MGYEGREVCREIKPGLYARDKTRVQVNYRPRLLINKMQG